ncbi:MAG: HD domain-containing protein [Candidatus Omnitrophica bacterium]|nr:HD domain-containing protein [Candidatus Omnitrophota bacterium]
MMAKKDKFSASVSQFISEAGLLKRVKRSGWAVLGIPESESVAEHSFRCAVIGYCLAKLEKASIADVLLMTLFNDIHEARITDLHKMAQKYITVCGPETQAFDDQVKDLPPLISSELSRIRREYVGQKTKESVISRDADILECLIQAKEYSEFGFIQAEKFMKKSPKLLKTKSARKLWQWVKNNPSNDWWQSLSNIQR